MNNQCTFLFWVLFKTTGLKVASLALPVRHLCSESTLLLRAGSLCSKISVSNPIQDVTKFYTFIAVEKSSSLEDSGKSKPIPLIM